MAFKKFTTRLSKEEWEMLERISESTSGNLKPSEKIRKMIHVEFSRRFRGVSSVEAGAYQTDFRWGPQRGRLGPQQTDRKPPQSRGERDE